MKGQMKERHIFGFAPNVFFLGVVSFLTDVSSEMIFTILPLFLTNVLGAGVPIVGYVEGVAESTASTLKVASGWISDKVGKRKHLAVFGYGLSTAAKPFMLIASVWGAAFIRFADRTGKGIRTSPRDALIADSIEPGERGRSFGFHRAMDSAGAVVGLSVAAAIIYFVGRDDLQLTRSTYNLMVLGGIVPAVISVIVLIAFVHERKKAAAATVKAAAGTAFPIQSKPKFDARFKWYLAIMVVFSLGNSSDAFLVLRSQDLGFTLLGIFLVLITFNITYTLVSTPAGALSDRLGRRNVMVAGWILYSLAYLGFALASATWMVWALFAFYGIYYAMTEGVGRAFVADLVPAEKRGTAYGYYHAVVGMTLLPASIIAGWMWTLVAPAAPFYFGAAMAGLAAVLLWVLFRKPS